MRIATEPRMMVGHNRALHSGMDTTVPCGRGEHNWPPYGHAQTMDEGGL